jgi:hypothetical protein
MKDIERPTPEERDKYRREKERMSETGKTSRDIEKKDDKSDK